MPDRYAQFAVSRLLLALGLLIGPGPAPVEAQSPAATPPGLAEPQSPVATPTGPEAQPAAPTTTGPVAVQTPAAAEQGAPEAQPPVATWTGPVAAETPAVLQPGPTLTQTPVATPAGPAAARTPAVLQPGPAAGKPGTAPVPPQEAGAYSIESRIEQYRSQGLGMPPGYILTAPTPAAEALQLLPDGRLKLGSLKLDLQSRTLSVPGSICLDRGILEYLAVMPSGKTHESLFIVDVSPVHLGLGLILMGLRQEVLSPRASKSTEWPPPVYHEGSKVAIRASWKTPDGQQVTVPVEELLIDRETQAPPQTDEWTYTGTILPEALLAQQKGMSLIGIWYDPIAFVNSRVRRQNPYRGEGFGLEVNAARVPPKGTPIELQISAEPDQDAPTPVPPS